MLVAAVAVAAPASAEIVKPFDEAAKDPSFLAFRAKLIRALKKGDVDTVVRMAHPNVKVSFGADNGRAQFRKYLAGDRDAYGKGAKARAAGYRRDLVRMLKLGGGFLKDGAAFAAPYTEAHDAREAAAIRAGRKARRSGPEIDPFARAFVLKPDTPVRAGPHADAKVVARLPQKIVALADKRVTATLPHDRRRPLWRTVQLPEGRTGWLRATDYYQSVDYRAWFENKDGRWRITSLVAGD